VVWFASWGRGCQNVTSLFFLTTIGSGAFAAGATFTSLSGRHTAAVALAFAVIVGLAVGAALLLAGLVYWAGKCAG